jgi:shikimate kinase
VALVGYRGTGKSTVGRLVAARLGRPFVDADAALEARLGRSIRSFFESFGEPAFRDREEALLAELTSVPDRVLATGGGVVLREANRDALRRFGFVVWLTADPAVLAARLEADQSSGPGRPALTASGTLGEVAAVLRVRTPLYRAVADAAVATDGRTPAEVADTVLAVLPRF